jgi:hypothetical protein
MSKPVCLLAVNRLGVSGSEEDTEGESCLDSVLLPMDGKGDEGFMSRNITGRSALGDEHATAVSCRDELVDVL